MGSHQEYSWCDVVWDEVDIKLLTNFMFLSFVICHHPGLTLYWYTLFFLFNRYF